MDQNNEQPSSPQQPQSVPQPEVLHVNHRSNPLLLVLGGVLLLGLGLVGGYFVANSAKMSSTPSQNVQQVIQPSPTSARASDMPAVTTPTVDPATVNWKKYTLPTLGVELKLPAELTKYGNFGEVVRTVTPPDTGRELRARILKGQGPEQYFTVSTISKDYSVGRGTGFGDIQGFTYNNGVYVAGFLGSGPEIPSEYVFPVTNPNKVEIIKVKSVYPDGELPPLYHQGNKRIGAIVNTKNNPEFPGFSIAMELNSELTEELFDQILSTITYTN